jgi:hypothetical protein
MKNIDILNDIIIEHVNIEKIIEDLKNDNISNAKDLDIEDIEMIIHKMNNQLDIELEELYSYEKYKLKKYYNYDKITPTFVKYYNNNNVKEIYKNLCDISSCDTIEESILVLLKKENLRYESIVNNNSNYKNKLEYIDLLNEKKIYNSLSHIITSKIITVFNNKSILAEEFDHIIDTTIWKTIELHSKYLEIDLNILIDSAKKITVVNKLLKKVYGLRIYKYNKYLNLKKSNIGKLFAFNTEYIEGVITIITTNKIFLELS